MMGRMPFHWALTGALPALFAMWYVDRLDARRPEPRSTLRKVALAGALSVIPVIIVGLVLMAVGPAEGTYERAAYDSYLVAAGVEELAKILCVYWFVYHRPEFDERFDGIVYGARAGLGFALVENVLYLAQAQTTGDFVAMYVLRAVLAVPGHAMWGAIMGYFLAVRRFDGRGPGLIGGYLWAVFLHGTYDMAIFVQLPLALDGYGSEVQSLLLISILVIAGGGLWLRRLARKALHADDHDEAQRLPPPPPGWQGLPTPPPPPDYKP